MTKKDARTAGTEALDQADAFGGVLARRVLHFDDGTTMKISPHPLLRAFDSVEQAEAWDDYQDEIETYDREKTIYLPEQKVRDADGKETGEVRAAEEIQGKVIGPPYRKDGVRVRPSPEVRIVQIALGEAKWAELLTKTIDGEPASYADVLRVWTDSGERMRERQAADPK